MLADALDPSKKGVGAAQASCLGDYMPVAIERLLNSAKMGCKCFKVNKLRFNHSSSTFLTNMLVGKRMKKVEVSQVARFKYPLVLLFLGLTALQAYLAISNMEQATGIPQTFPDWHNQETGKLQGRCWLPVERPVVVENPKVVENCMFYCAHHLL